MRYKCNICGSYLHEAICNKCKENGSVTKMRINYCIYCHIPVWNNKDECPECGKKLSISYSDVVPVFLEEKILLSAIYEEDIYNKVVWNIGSNRYLVNSERRNLNIKDTKMIEDVIIRYKRLIGELDVRELIDKEIELFKLFVRSNEQRFKDIETESHDYVRKTFLDNSERTVIVSFSGGKDSIVVSDVVRQALSSNNIIHIFGNTTLEMNETIEFVENYKKQYPQIPFIESKSDKNFDQLCEEIGPPTRIRSWCCSVFKSGPISQTLNFVNYYENNNEQKKFLTFYGIRGEESAARNKYGRTSESPKITSQRVASPVFGWLDYDIWLYILSRKLEFNPAYRFGYRRVGCWCCPNNSRWSELLNSIYTTDKYNEWKKYLYNFAQKIGKEDYKDYIDDGFWKARHGGNGLNNEHTKINRTECIDKDYENFIIKRPYTQELDEYLKPFGKVQKTIDEDNVEIEVFNKKSNKKLFKIKTHYGSTILKCIIYGTVYKSLTIQRIECQLRKYQICIRCSACDSVCPKGAISTLNNMYRINEDKCVHCLECIAKHFAGGCLMNEVLIQKEDKI